MQSYLISFYNPQNIRVKSAIIESPDRYSALKLANKMLIKSLYYKCNAITDISELKEKKSKKKKNNT